MTESTTAFIAFGANLGDRLATLRAAAAAIDNAEGVSVSAASALYETAPVGGPGDQPSFYNAVARVETTLPPESLLALLQSIEAEHLRARDVRWGPRTLDLDLLFYGDAVLETAHLEAPHPRLHQRRFVLKPLADVGADHVHPKLNKTVRELLDMLAKDDEDDVRPVLQDWSAHV